MSTPGTVLCSAVAQGNESVWDWLWQRYLNTHNANEKVVIMTSLKQSLRPPFTTTPARTTV